MPEFEAAKAAWPAVLEARTLRPLRDGHINDTYDVDGRYVLQRINGNVFAAPRAVMRNLVKAVAHEGGRRLVAPVPTSAGEPFAVDAAGDVWRLFPRVPSRSFQNLPDALLAPAAGAFGGFLATFADFPADFPDALEPVIDGFHDLPRYLARLDAMPKINDAAAELRAVAALRGNFQLAGRRQTIHGDCKVNNLLFHPAKPQVVAIIDLDTIMVGDPAWDFGDLVRSTFAGADETSDGTPFSMARYQRVCEGFARGFPAIDDSARYATAPAYMSFMLGVRFLTDHLRGDAYFKVSQRGDNLLRARSQLALARRFHDHADAMTKTLDAARRTAR